MDKYSKWEEELFKTYPKLFAQVNLPANQTCMCWGCEHDEGWFDLLKETCEKLKDYPVEFEQIKEKLGGLRIYYRITEDISEEVYKTIDNITTESEDKSFKICEVCGKEGQLSSCRGWYKVLCSEHRGDKYTILSNNEV